MTVVSAGVEAQSFLATRDAWLAGAVNIAELLRMQRLPEVIGTVPNPDEFDQTRPFEVQIHGADPDVPAGKVLAGRLAVANMLSLVRGPDSAELEYSFGPALAQIHRHATEVMGVDLDDALANIRLQSVRGAEWQRAFGITHFDTPHDPENSVLVYLASSHNSTAFPMGFSVPESTEYPPEDFAHQIALEAMLTRQREPEQPVFQAEPHQIVLIDETIPHEVPRSLAFDESLRTSLRVWIEQRRASAPVA